MAITTLCLGGCAQECGGCHGHIHRYRVAPQTNGRWFILVPDQAEVLAGEIGPGDEALAIRTRQRLLVDLISAYIRDSIALATVVSDLGDRLEQLLRPETKSVLAAVGAGGPGNGWLEHMRSLLRRRTLSDGSFEGR